MYEQSSTITLTNTELTVCNDLVNDEDTMYISLFARLTTIPNRTAIGLSVLEIHDIPFILGIGKSYQPRRGSLLMLHC